MERSLFISNSRHLPWAFLITFSFVSIVYAIELFLLPINFFTFRVWEALVAQRFYSGHFYPNMKISMLEVGDLGHHTPFAVKKRVEWETDRYGFRKHDSGVNRYRVVIIGDSNIDGSGLTQDDTLFEVLGRRLKCGVYPFTNGNIFTSERFRDNPPEVVILESIERSISALEGPEPNQTKSSWIESVSPISWIPIPAWRCWRIGFIRITCVSISRAGSQIFFRFPLCKAQRTRRSFL